MKPSIIALAATFSLALTGCATTGEQTAVQRAMGQCAVAVGGGALLGAVIGNNVGDGDAGTGAAVGALAGAGACGFLLYRASEEDKQRIRDLELAALNRQDVGTTQETFTSTNGEDEITVVTTTEEVPEDQLPEIQMASADTISDSTDAAVPAADGAAAPEEVKYTNCRYVKQDMAVGGQTLNGSKQLTCRTTAGDWVNF